MDLTLWPPVPDHTADVWRLLPCGCWTANLAHDRLNDPCCDEGLALDMARNTARFRYLAAAGRPARRERRILMAAEAAYAAHFGLRSPFADWRTADDLIGTVAAVIGVLFAATMFVLLIIKL